MMPPSVVRPVLAAHLLSFAFATAACSSSSSGTSPGAETAGAGGFAAAGGAAGMQAAGGVGAGGAATGGASGTGGGAAGLGGASAGAAGAAGTGGATVMKSGYVELGLAADGKSSYAFAGFSDGTKGNSCPRVLEAAGCWVYDCNMPMAGTGGGSSVALGAGDITVTGGPLTTPLLLKYDATSGYPSVSGGAAYKLGDMFTATAPGGAVPAFMLTGTAPDAVALATPMCASKACGDFDRTVDFTFTWTGGAGGGLAVNLQTADPSGVAKGAIGVACTQDGAAHTATLPKELLAKLFKDPKAGFSIFSRTQAITMVGDWQLKMNVDNLGTTVNFNIAK